MPLMSRCLLLSIIEIQRVWGFFTSQCQSYVGKFRFVLAQLRFGEAGEQEWHIVRNISFKPRASSQRLWSLELLKFAMGSSIYNSHP